MGATMGSPRVAIIGGGAAGIAARRELVRAGIDVRVGGKCRTFVHRGASYELGATLLTPTYRRVRALLREVGLDGEVGVPSTHTASDARARRLVPAGVSLARLPLAGARLAREVVRHRALLRPGFAGCDRMLAEPFDAWARSRGLEAAAGLVVPWFTAFGYGYPDEMSAAYVLKYSRVARRCAASLLEESACVA